jgi:hypothetical protein
MTKAQARAEAAQRWSQRGEFGSAPQVCLRIKKYANRCMVGYLLWKDAERRQCDPLLIGEGPTWEAAFAHANKREAAGLPPLRAGFL